MNKNSDFSPKIIIKGQNKYIFDIIRKKYVRLTPEELVRQQFVAFLIYNRGVPQGLISIEQSIRYNELSRRTDIVVYDRNGRAVMLVECKAPGVSLNTKVFDQILSYNIKLRVKYLVVTNGASFYAVRIDNNSNITYLKDIPYFEDLVI